MRRSPRSRILPSLLTIGLTACDLARGGGPVVGFAYTQGSAPYVELARATLAARGGVVPEMVYDSTAPTETSDGALAFAAALIGRKDVAVVVGPSNSRHTLATAPAYNAAGLSEIVPSATNRRIRGAGPYTFTLVPDDSVEGDYLAHFARRILHARRALLFYVNDEYGDGLRSGIVSTFVREGGELSEVIPIGNGTDIPTLLSAAIARRRPDVVICAGRAAETGLVLKAVRSIAPGTPVVAGDGAYYEPLLTATAGPDLSGLYVLSFWVFDSTDPAHRAFAAQVHRILHADPKPEDALTIDALILAATARAAAGPDRDAVHRWLLGLGHDHPPFHGLTGEIAFGPERKLPLTMVRFRNGVAERVADSLVAPGTAP
jgi:ABC-type branched-subunit amino acid transport system substrate-binding protein